MEDLTTTSYAILILIVIIGIWIGRIITRIARFGGKVGTIVNRLHERVTRFDARPSR